MDFVYRNKYKIGISLGAIAGASVVGGIEKWDTSDGVANEVGGIIIGMALGAMCGAAIVQGLVAIDKIGAKELQKGGFRYTENPIRR